MCRIISLSLVLVFVTLKLTAQSGGFDTLWKNVDILIGTQERTKSALELVEQIYIKAKKEKNQAQVIKALVRKIGLQTAITEGQDQPITLIQQEVALSTGTAKSILCSLLAEAYFNYYSNNRYKLVSRTPTKLGKGKDFTTWSFDDFHQEIARYYELSLQPLGLLQKTALAAFDPIITKGNARYLRPTLYDLLAHRALEYFRNEERDLTRPSYAFSFDRPEYFGTAESFIGMSIQSKDSASVHHKALLILQQLLAFHKNDAKPDAFIDADLVRLQLINQFGVMDNKDSLYMNALETIVNRYPREAAAAKAMYYLAAKHAERAAQYDPIGDTTNRYEYLKAEAICLQAIALPGSSEGKSMCNQLMETIRTKSITSRTEKVNLPGSPFRSLVSYKNLTSIFIRLVKLNDEQTLIFPFNYNEQRWKEVTSVTPLRNWQQSLPSTGDHQVHRTEIKIDALPVGSYLVLASDSKGFEPLTSFLSAEVIHVSRISFVQSGLNYFVLDRETGKPLEKVSVQFWNGQYDYVKRKNNFTRTDKAETDKNGRFSYVPTSNTTENPRMEFTYQSDHLLTTDQANIYFYPQSQRVDDAGAFEKANANAYIFTDRAIYRPGQTVFFKSLLLTKEFKTGRPKLKTAEKSTFGIVDANGQKIDSVELVTNEFGSCTGQFKIPSSLLSGSFRITNSTFGGEAWVMVEEYKRPRFEVDLKNPEGLFKLGDTIRINGHATAFAGNTLGGVKVAYRVVRQARFIYTRSSLRRGFPSTPSVEITNGVTQTNENGAFKISFNAFPDQSILPSLEPVFDYKIIADITDLNGETQSKELIVSVSYKALQLHIENFNGRNFLKTDLNEISISSKNMGGKFERSKLAVSFYPLKAPQRLIRSRYWETPDQFAMTREQFLKDFPLDEYENESDYKTWETIDQPILFTGSTKENGAFILDQKKIKAGWYRVEAVTRDRYGLEVKDSQYLRVIDPAEKEQGSYDYFLKAEGKSTLEPGASFTTTIGSPATDIYLLREIDTMKNIGYQGRKEANTSIDIIRLNKELKSFTIPVTEKDRGGFGINYFFVRDNRLFSSNSSVQVPWTNKELVISYESFRDKTMPGSLERWKLKISGKGKDKLAAEMLASMYDVSLDQFTPHQWNKPDVWPVHGLNHLPDGRTNFAISGSGGNYPIKRSPGNFVFNYDQLISIPSNFGGIYLRNKSFHSEASRSSLEQVAVTPVAGYSSAKKVSMASDRESEAGGSVPSQPPGGDNAPGTPQPTAIKARSDFRETAFFLPQMHTDSSGNIAFSFTMPEAITRWKLQVLAHTEDASFGYSSREVITQKELMVQPNPTRFLREGDQLELTTKIVNLSSGEMKGTVHLELFDASTMQPVDGAYKNIRANQSFTAAAGQSALASFPIKVPFQYGRALLYRFTAKTTSGNNELGDGEEAILPVLTNSILVTETVALPMLKHNSQQFSFDKLLASGKSETLKNQALTVEFTTNPSWYALMSLPYLAESNFHCSERLFNQYYANAIAIMIANSSPKIKA
ncbi:MAG: alpha-2-macroglobulin family protein, partial [Chitinophagaceae bacterium]